MTTWTIKAGRYPIDFLGIPTGYGHLYVTIHAYNTLLHQYHGHPRDENGNLKQVGSDDNFINAYIDPSPPHDLYDPDHDMVTLFSTDNYAEIELAQNYLLAAMEYINAQMFHYQLTPSSTSDFFNSNSVFSALVFSLQSVLPISQSNVDTAKNLGGDISDNSGVDKDIFQGMVWSPNLDDPSHKGYVLIDVSGYNNLIGGAGNDELSGGSGDDTIRGNGGNDIIIASANAAGTGLDADVYNGGTEIDTVDYSGVGFGVKVEQTDAETFAISRAGAATTDPRNTLMNIEELILTGQDDIIRLNGGLPMHLRSIKGGAGYDTVDFGGAVYNENTGETSTAYTGTALGTLESLSSIESVTGFSALIPNFAANGIYQNLFSDKSVIYTTAAATNDNTSATQPRAMTMAA